jgi:prepilin-type N-terminal cleavage/methylation domain-containing protein
MKNFYKKGLTVIEILMVIAILAILAAIILPQFSKMRENQLLKNAISDILSSLNKAQSQTLASVNSSEYGVHFQSDRVIIFKGKVFSSSAEDNETILIGEPVGISNVTLGGVSGASGDMYFNRLSGAPSATGTVAVSASSISKIITIFATGTVSLN